MAPQSTDPDPFGWQKDVNGSALSRAWNRRSSYGSIYIDPETDIVMPSQESLHTPPKLPTRNHGASSSDGGVLMPPTHESCVSLQEELFEKGNASQNKLCPAGVDQEEFGYPVTLNPNNVEFESDGLLTTPASKVLPIDNPTKMPTWKAPPQSQTAIRLKELMSDLSGMEERCSWLEHRNQWLTGRLLNAKRCFIGKMLTSNITEMKRRFFEHWRGAMKELSLERQLHETNKSLEDLEAIGEDLSRAFEREQREKVHVQAAMKKAEEEIARIMQDNQDLREQIEADAKRISLLERNLSDAETSLFQSRKCSEGVLRAVGSYDEAKKNVEVVNDSKPQMGPKEVSDDARVEAPEVMWKMNSILPQTTQTIVHSVTSQAMHRLTLDEQEEHFYKTASQTGVSGVGFQENHRLPFDKREEREEFNFEQFNFKAAPQTSVKNATFSSSSSCGDSQEQLPDTSFVSRLQSCSTPPAQHRHCSGSLEKSATFKRGDPKGLECELQQVATCLKTLESFLNPEKDDSQDEFLLDKESPRSHYAPRGHYSPERKLSQYAYRINQPAISGTSSISMIPPFPLVSVGPTGQAVTPHIQRVQMPLPTEYVLQHHMPVQVGAISPFAVRSVSPILPPDGRRSASPAVSRSVSPAPPLHRRGSVSPAPPLHRRRSVSPVAIASRPVSPAPPLHSRTR